MTWPVSPVHVRGFMGSTQTTPDTGLDLAVDAVNAYVPGVPALSEYVIPEDPDDPEAPTFDPPGDVFLGAVMLAARWYERRGSVLGNIAGYSDMATTMILRQDPDVARLLRLGTFAPFGFGAPSLPVATP
jgi:hypothetical protein